MRRRCERRKRGGWRRRGSLRKVLFVWFLLSLLASGFAGAFAFRLWGGADVERSGVSEFIAHRLARVWDSPRERTAFVEDLERVERLRVALRSEDGRVLRAAECDRPWSVPVVRAGEALGVAELCLRGPRHAPGRLLFAAFAALTVLLAMSGALAHRLSAPFRRVAEVARRLAEGETDARVGSLRGGGEAAILARSFDHMADRLAARLAEQRDLLAHVSHELRTPLGHLRLLLAIGREGERVDWDELERELEELEELVAQLLARSRVDLGLLDRRAVDPIALATRALARQGVPESRLASDWSGGTFFLDPTLVERALANLLRNAEAYGQGLRMLRVAGAPDEGLSFHFIDGGQGFVLSEDEASDEERVPLEALDEERTRTGRGLGLGLPLARSVADAHGGTLHGERSDEGFAVVLTLRP